MTDEQIRCALDEYQATLERLNASPEQFPHERQGPQPAEGRNHAASMIPRMREMVDDPAQREKLMRWMGFLQGVLWLTGVYTMHQLRDHNRPPST